MRTHALLTVAQMKPSRAGVAILLEFTLQRAATATVEPRCTLKRELQRAAWNVFVAAIVTSIGGLSAASARADDKRMENLGAQPADDYDRELFGGKPGESQPAGPDATTRQRLERELGAAAEAEDGTPNPLVPIARQMLEVQDRLSRRDAGTETRHVQKQIVDDLDRLIEQARKSGNPGSLQAQAQNSSSRTPSKSPTTNPKETASKQPSGKAATESNPEARPKSGDGQPATLQVRSMAARLWGELPEQQRQQMLNLPEEEALPKYRSLVEEYFRRLSEDNPSARNEP